MIHVLIIYAHPNQQSLNAKIKDILLEELKSIVDVQVIDLYQDGFADHLSLAELYTAKNYQVSQLTKKYQSQITASDWLIFVHPVWWYNMPSILKSFFDKVFIPRFAFKFNEFGIPKGLLSGKKAIIIQTYASSRIIMYLFSFNIAYRNIKQSILQFCGIKVIKCIPIFSANKINSDNIQTKLSAIYKIKKLII